MKFIIRRLRSHLPTIPAAIVASSYEPKREMISVPLRDDVTLDLIDRNGWWWAVAVVIENGRVTPPGDRGVHSLNVRTTANPDTIADAFFSYMMAILDALGRVAEQEVVTEDSPSSQPRDGDGVDDVAPVGSIKEMADRVAEILSQLPWLSVSYLPLSSSPDGGNIRISSPYSGDSIALINNGKWVLWRPRPDGQPRFIHDLELNFEVPPAFLCGQIANIEAQDLFEIMEQGGDYIRANYPDFGSEIQFIVPFWNWLPQTLDVSEKPYQDSLDEMSAVYLQHFIDTMKTLTDE